MRAAAGLQIVALISISRTRPVPIGGFTAMVFTRPGLASSSASVIQRLVTSASAAIIAAKPASILLLVEAGFRNIEVKAAFLLADRAAGDRIGQHGREQMQRGMHAHARVTRLPIDDRAHFVAAASGGRACGRNMRDLCLDCIGVDRRCRWRSSAPPAASALRDRPAVRRTWHRTPSGRARCRHCPSSRQSWPRILSDKRRRETDSRSPLRLRFVFTLLRRERRWPISFQATPAPEAFSSAGSPD